MPPMTGSLILALKAMMETNWVYEKTWERGKEREKGGSRGR